jgi:hypothetical protein
VCDEKKRRYVDLGAISCDVTNCTVLHGFAHVVVNVVVMRQRA